MQRVTLYYVMKIEKQPCLSFSVVEIVKMGGGNINTLDIMDN